MGRAKELMMDREHYLENGMKDEWIESHIAGEIDKESDEWQNLSSEFDEESYQVEHSDEVFARQAYEKDEAREKRQEEKAREKAIKRTKKFTIVEYAPNNWILENLAKEISSQVYSHFILFDHKGNIETDNKEALNALLTKEVDGNIYIGKQMFMVDTDLLDINEHNFFQSIGYQDKKETEKTVTNPNIKMKIKSDIKPVLGVETIAEILSSIIVNQPDDRNIWKMGKRKNIFS